MNFLQATRRVMQLAVVGAALSSPLPAMAATPAAVAAATELVKATGAAALFNTLVPGVIEQSKILFLQQNPGLAGDLNEIAAKMRTELAPRLNELYAEVGKIYAEQFSEQELKELTIFFSSPVGKKYVNEQSVVVNASLKFAQEWANKLSDEVTPKMREELKKKGHAL